MSLYELDRLGWYEFELLCQSLLTAEFGIAVESWGGRSDWGRDAYVKESLNFPNKEISTNGPFLFQVKFVKGANAPDVNPSRSLEAAVCSELRRIEARVSKNQWETPEHYVLLTNCPITSSLRTSIERKYSKILPLGRVHVRGSSDISSLLDCYESVRLSFPQILGIKDLRTLLTSIVNNNLIVRASSLIEEAKDLSRVFVATDKYYEALEVLRKHGFVVLGGPPEMGKTSIANMLALSFLSKSWEVVDCRNPEDFFMGYTSAQKQLFLADDAFGKTEFDISLGRKWERDLSRVLTKLDSSHRMIWTSRKHILESAMNSVDLSGRARYFPRPGEVVVDASEMSRTEKARILYRHSKEYCRSNDSRKLIKQFGERLVSEKHFTPERIRRLVMEELEELVHALSKSSYSANEIYSRISETIRNPTASMRKSFKALSDDHKWLLISLFDAENDTGKLEDYFFNYHRTVSSVFFNELLRDMDGTFIRVQVGSSDSFSVDWIHPSYKDLVIEELSFDLDLQLKFVRNSSHTTIRLILSHLKTSNEMYGFLESEELKSAFIERCRYHARSDIPIYITMTLDFIRSVSVRSQEGVIKDFLNNLTYEILEAVFVRYKENQIAVPVYIIVKLREHSEVAEKLGELSLELSLQQHVNDLDRIFEDSPPYSYAFIDIARILEVISDRKAVLFESGVNLRRIIRKICNTVYGIEGHMQAVECGFGSDDAEDYPSYIEDFINGIDRIYNIPEISKIWDSTTSKSFIEVSSVLQDCHARIEEKIEDWREEEELEAQHDEEEGAYWSEQWEGNSVVTERGEEDDTDVNDLLNIGPSTSDILSDL